MNITNNNHFRILAVSLSTNGFGYAVMEGEPMLIEYRNKMIYSPTRMPNRLTHIDKLIVHYQPNVMVLQ